eukprot:15475813-Alexandrium_andersonii.AAC.1
MKMRSPSRQGHGGPSGSAKRPAQVATRGRPVGRVGGGASGGVQPRAAFRCVGPITRATADGQRWPPRPSW